MSSTPAQLRPLGIGEILDAGIKIYRSKFATMLKAVAVVIVRVGGEPEGFLTAAVRNFLRIVDFLPAFYVVGVVAILVTGRNQRLGDLAAGTLVVRERRPAVTPAATYLAPPAVGAPFLEWDVSASASRTSRRSGSSSNGASR